jgi:hypothetical protein
VGERLAWKPGAHDVHRFDPVPVDGRQIAEVRHVGPVVGQQLVAALVDFRVPGKVCAVMGFDGHVEAAIARAERSEAHHSSGGVVDANPALIWRMAARPSTVVL